MDMTRKLGRSDIDAGMIGIGCWAIGGDSYGEIDDNESIRAIRRALDLGVKLIDTANCYGSGHSETVVGSALAGRRHEAVIATKFGFGEECELVSKGGRECTEAVKRACEQSLKRLNTDYIDLYQLHQGALDGAPVDDVIKALEELLSAGKIRAFGWSTDTPENARRFAGLEHCAAIQYQLNMFYDNAEITRICEESGVTGLVRGPLAMGSLTGKYNAAPALGDTDVRGRNIIWVPYFSDGKMRPEFTEKLDAVRGILTSGGRTLAQGALAWIWAKSKNAVPIPGFKSVKQVEENTGALKFGPLEPGQMKEIASLIPPLAWTQM